MLNKAHIKAKMLTLTEDELTQTRQDYELFLKEARVDKSESFDRDDLAQASSAAEVARAFDDRLHSYDKKLAQLRETDFSSKQVIEPGAIIRSGERHFVIAVSTRAFQCDGLRFMGISTAAPIYEKLRDTEAGSQCSFRGMALTIDDIF